MLDYSILPATVDEADDIAALHAESWRSAYRGFLPDAFLDGPLLDERRELWGARMREPNPHRRAVFKAVSNDTLAGFACILLDKEPSWGALLDNLHIKPALKRRGIGRQLFEHARRWVNETEPGTALHLTVIEANVDARRFYDRLGGIVVERKMRHVVPGTELAVLRYRWESPRSSS